MIAAQTGQRRSEVVADEAGGGEFDGEAGHAADEDDQQQQGGLAIHDVSWSIITVQCSVPSRRARRSSDDCLQSLYRGRCAALSMGICGTQNDRHFRGQLDTSEGLFEHVARPGPTASSAGSARGRRALRPGGRPACCAARCAAAQGCPCASWAIWRMTAMKSSSVSFVSVSVGSIISASGTISGK